LEAGGWVKPRRPKGRAVARGLDAAAGLQHAFMPGQHEPMKKIYLTVITVSTAIIIVLGEAHLRRILKSYARYYNRASEHPSVYVVEEKRLW